MDPDADPGSMRLYGFVMGKHFFAMSLIALASQAQAGGTAIR